MCLIGRITKDIELRTTQSGNAYVEIFIAINNGKKEDGTDRPAYFPKIYVYGKQAENLSKYCHKGSKVGVEGKIATHSWDKEDGSKGYETYVIGNKIEFLENKSSESAPAPEPETYSNEVKNEDPFASFGSEVVLNDDDLPF